MWMSSRCRASGTLALIALLGVSMSGCGFLITQAPPPNHEQLDYFPCTESNAGPIIDLVWAGLNVIGAVLIAADPDSYSSPGAGIAVGLAWGAVSTPSAIIGFKKTRQCRDAKALLAARQRAQRTGEAPPGGEVVQAVTVTSPADTIMVGERVQLTATAHSSSGAAVPDRFFLWSSSNVATASVNGAGLVTAHAEGTVAIAAQTGNAVGIATIVVVGRP